MGLTVSGRINLAGRMRLGVELEWTPADTFTEGWWDASNADSINPSTGGAIIEWNDLSGNNRNFGPRSGTSSTPVFVPANNEVTFSNVSSLDGTFTNTEVLNGDVVMVGVLSATTFYPAKNWHGQLQLTNLSQAGVCFGKSNGGGVAYYNSVGAGSALWPNNDPATRMPSYQRTGTDLEYYLEGELASSNTGVTSLANSGSQTMYMGNGSYGYYGATAGGSYNEFVVLAGANATAANRQKTEGYLAWKWGLEADLPVGHPYKNAPP